jgi:hypothetical protein
MLTVTLKLETAEELNSLANETQTEAGEIVERAVRQYLDRFRLEKIHAETEAFIQQRRAILEQYRGEYVALHEGRVIDHDLDLRSLHLRVFDRLGHTPVLLKRAIDEPEREIVFRSPRRLIRV